MMRQDTKKRKLTDDKENHHIFDDDLPPKYQFIKRLFSSLERVLLVYQGKRIRSLKNIKSVLEMTLSRCIGIEHFEMIETIFPGAYTYEHMRIIDKETSESTQEIVITLNWKRKELFDLELESKKRLDIFDANILALSRRNCITKDLDFPMNDNQFKDIERTPIDILRDSESFLEYKKEALTIDELLLGKDHEVIKKMKQTKEKLIDMTKRLKTGESIDNILNAPIPKELGDVNPIMIYQSRENEELFNEVANPEYLKKENERKILKDVIDLCERMNR